MAFDIEMIKSVRQHVVLMLHEKLGHPMTREKILYSHLWMGVRSKLMAEELIMLTLLR
jgi:hypothetical protein